MRATFREPQRPWLFALVVLIHAGLFQLLVSQRQAAPQLPERESVLTLLPAAEKLQPSPPPPVAPVTPELLPELSLPTSMPPLLIAPPESDGTSTPPLIDWQREAEAATRKQALAAESKRDPKGGRPKAKPEFGWDRSRVHPVDPIESGGLVVRLSDRCVIVITLLAMPACKIGKKPARGDLFEHMDDATPGDWKDE